MIRKLSPLAFDHVQIPNYAVERLCTKLEYTTGKFQSLPEKFKLMQRQEAYEAISQESSTGVRFVRRCRCRDSQAAQGVPTHRAPTGTLSRFTAIHEVESQEKSAKFLCALWRARS